jgi:hypothetical protein
MVWRLAGLYGDPLDRRALEAFAGTAAGTERLERSSEARIVLEAYDVNPDAWSAPPRPLRTLATLRP